MQNKDAPQVFKRIGADFNKFFNGPLTKSTVKCNCSAVPCLKENQIDALLEISVKTAIADAKAVIKTFSSLCCPVQNVMVDMAYTLGGTSLAAFTTFVSLVNRQYWKMAGDDLTCSKWCNAKGQDIKRCHRDAAIVTKGCGCSGNYPQVCTPTASSCCASQETCCKGQEV
jgi:GH24 family phage-related lysozyme (muramidase)